MPASALVKERLETLHQALQQQLTANNELLEATTRLGNLVGDGAGASNEALHEAVIAHGKLFDAAQTAEERSRQERFRLQELMGHDRWNLDEVKHYVRMHVPVYWGSEEQNVMDSIAAVVDKLRAVTERLITLTEHVEGLMQKGLKSVGGQARTVSRGRHAANAYAGGSGPGFARFIDKRE